MAGRLAVLEAANQGAEPTKKWGMVVDTIPRLPSPGGQWAYRSVMRCSIQATTSS